MSNINLWNIYNNLFILIEKREWTKKPEKLEKTEFELALRIFFPRYYFFFNSSLRLLHAHASFSRFLPFCFKWEG